MDEFDKLILEFEKKGIIKIMYKSDGQILGGHNNEKEI